MQKLHLTNSLPRVRIEETENVTSTKRQLAKVSDM